MNDKKLLCTIGLPRSGKSTWAAQKSIEIGCPIVCPDAIRLALHGSAFIGSAEPFVWAVAQTMVRALFLAGHDRVILDATNNTKNRREMWNTTLWDLEYHIMRTSPEECIERAKMSNRPELIPIITKMDEEKDWGGMK